MGTSKSKLEKIAPSAVIYNLKGKEVPKIEEGYYNLQTNRHNKDKRAGLIYDDFYRVGGTTEELNAFYEINHIIENRVCEAQKNTILYAPNTEDISTIPDDLLESLCPFNLAGLRTKCKVINVLDGDTFYIALFVPLKFLYTPKYYQHESKAGQERKSVTEEKHETTAHMKQTVLLKTSKPSSKKITEGGLYMVFDCRLLGYDSAEHDTAQGKLATKLTIELFKKYNNILYVQCGYFDKYGRLLVDLYSDSLYKNYLNDYLYKHPDPVLGVLALPYSGATKSEYMKNLPVISH